MGVVHVIGDYIRPESIPGVVEVWDASDLTGMVKDGSNVVSSWTGLKGRFTLQNSTPSERPTYVAADGQGVPYVDFNNQRLVQTSESFDPANLGFFAVIQDNNSFPLTAGAANTLFSQEKSTVANRSRLFHASAFQTLLTPVFRSEGHTTAAMYLDGGSVANNTVYVESQKVALGANITDVDETDYFGVCGAALANSYMGKARLYQLVLAERHFTDAEFIALTANAKRRKVF